MEKPSLFSLFPYLPSGMLTTALRICYSYILEKDYLKFFDHPEVSLVPETMTRHAGRMVIDDQHQVIISETPVKNTEEYFRWIEKHDVDEDKFRFTLSDLIGEMSGHCIRYFGTHDKEFFFTCASLGWVCNNLRYIAIHGLEEHEKAVNIWDFNRY